MAGTSWVSLDGETFPSLGYQVADWMSEFLLQTDTADYVPFTPTLEQLEFLISLYRLDPHTGRRVINRAVLSRPRGWGKSPFVGAIGLAELLGPVRCDGFDSYGQPVGVPVSEFRTPKVLIAATSKEQTDNTFEAVRELLDGSLAEDEYRLELQEERVLAPRGEMKVITSSGTSIKGARGSCSIMDQTETWLPSNGGVKLAQVLRNNATKLDGFTIETPNAYTIGENSVAESSAKFADRIRSGKVRGAEKKDAAHLLYDHRSADLTTDLTDRESLIAGLRLAYGDSSAHPDGCVLHDPPCDPGWVNVHRAASDFWDTSNDPEVMKADFLNIIGAASDSWLSEPDLRRVAASNVELPVGEPVCLGFDGSEGRKTGIADSTVLIGFAPRLGWLFEVGVWEQPDGPKGEGWRPPHLEIEQTVKRAFDEMNVVGFFADPSAGWNGNVKQWEATYGRQLKVHHVSKAEPIRWNQRAVSDTAEMFRELRSAILAETVTYDGSPVMTRHFLNARRDPRRAGYVLKKADDNQDYGKIDAAYGAMLAYAAGMKAIGAGVLNERPRAVFGGRRLN